MAAVTKMKPGSRVKLKIGFSTVFGKYVEPGRIGVVSKFSPVRFPDRSTYIWVWWKKGDGAWCPIRNLVRLKDKEPTWPASKAIGKRRTTRRARSPRGTSRTRSTD